MALGAGCSALARSFARVHKLSKAILRPRAQQRFVHCRLHAHLRSRLLRGWQRAFSNVYLPRAIYLRSWLGTHCRACRPHAPPTIGHYSSPRACASQLGNCAKDTGRRLVVPHTRTRTRPCLPRIARTPTARARKRVETCRAQHSVRRLLRILNRRPHGRCSCRLCLARPGSASTSHECPVRTVAITHRQPSAGASAPAPSAWHAQHVRADLEEPLGPVLLLDVVEHLAGEGTCSV